MTGAAVRPFAPTASGFVAGNWKAISKNTLAGIFDLKLPSGLILCGCQLHQKNETRWIGLPATRYLKSDGTLSDYVKCVDFVDTKSRNRFQELAKAAVDDLLASAPEGDAA
jgi:hypothetical protein